MRSAAAGFIAHGYGYNFTVSDGDYIKDQATALGWLKDLPSAPGFFNIPIVDLTGNERIGDIDALNGILEDQKFSYQADGPRGLYCYVVDYTDKNGAKFTDQLPQDVRDQFENNCDLGYWDT